jgi:REP element-mobilizing transposase RayT
MLAESLADANGRFGLELLAHSLHPDHLHLLVRARDRAVLSRGMTGLCVRMARGLNTLWRRGGIVFADRYEARALRTARELRAARRSPCAWRTAPGAPGPKRPTRCAVGAPPSRAT